VGTKEEEVANELFPDEITEGDIILLICFMFGGSLIFKMGNNCDNTGRAGK
jgi:hypothetical protein